VVRASIVMAASGAGDAAAKPRKFHMDAYTGGPMSVLGWRYPIVLDLTGLTVRAGAKVYLDHDRRARVGHIEGVEIEQGTLRVKGVVSSTSAAAREVVADADNGYPWQASVGASVVEHELIQEGQKTKVNGRELAGPLNVARRAVLAEVSFVGSGADDETSAKIAAEAAHRGGQDMEFEAWLKAKGFDPEKLSEDQKKVLRASWEADPAGGKKAGEDDPKPKADVKPPAAPVAASAADGDIDQVIADQKRKGAIKDLAIRYVEENPARAEDIKAALGQALEKNWTLGQTELALLRLCRAAPPNTTCKPVEPQTEARELEAGLVLAGGLPEPEKHYPAEVLERAHKRFPHGLSLGESLVLAARAGGWTGHSLRGDIRGVLEAAFPRRIEAGFSTIDIGGILSAVSGKFLLAGFMSVERTWRNICAVRNVADFKTVTSYRLIGKEQYEPVAPGGRLKHGTLGEETFTNKADTFGLLLSIDRRDMINDDVGAITTVPRKLGRGSGLKINDLFWTVFLANTALFPTDKSLKNYLNGAESALGIDGLTAAEAAFLDMVDADGKPTGIMPQILLAPTALSAMGTQLFKSLEIRDTTDDVRYPVANPHAGKFRVEISRYLANSHYTGHSATAWYLLADPNDLPVIEVAFLDGKEAPTIETAQADFDVLGIQMRAYHDFGVALQDPKGGVMNAGV
jgi:hypothetical protein